MGLLKRLAGRRAGRPAAPVHVELDALPAFVDACLAEPLRKANAACREIHEQLCAGFSGVRAALEELDRAQSKTGERIDAPVNMLKADFVKKARAALAADLLIPEPADYPSLERLHRTASASVSQIMHVQPKQALALSHYFSKNRMEIAERIRILEERIAAFDRFLNTEAQVIRRYGLLNAAAERQKMLDAGWAHQQKRRQDITERLMRGTQEEERKRKELRMLCGGDEWTAHEERKKRAAENENRMASAAKDMATALAGGERVFRKFVHQDNDPLARRLIEDPLAAILENNDREIVSLVDRIIARGPRFGLTGKEVSRLGALKEALGMIAEQRKEYRRLAAENSELRKRMDDAGIQKMKAGLESALRRLEEERSGLAEVQEEIGQEEERIRLSMEDTKAEIEQLLLEAAGQEVVLQSSAMTAI